MAYLIVLAFITGVAGHGWSVHTVKCNDWACVKMIEEGAVRDPNMAQLQVYRKGDYATGVANSTLGWWKPIVNERFM